MFCKKSLTNDDVSSIPYSGPSFSSVVEYQLRPESGSLLAQMLNIFDVMFTILFAVELAVNMFAHWFWAFMWNGWNLFDAAVILMSMVALWSNSSLNHGSLRSMRLVRSLRIVRLLRKLTSLRKIVFSVTSALRPVAEAFSVVLLIMCIYAAVGVEYYA